MLPDTTGSQKCKMVADKPEVNTSQLAHGIVRSFDKRLILSYCENK